MIPFSTPTTLVQVHKCKQNQYHKCRYQSRPHLYATSCENAVFTCEREPLLLIYTTA